MAFEGIILAMLYLAAIVFCLVAAGFVAVVSYIMYLRRVKYAHIPGPPVKNFFKGHLDELVNETKRGLPTADFVRQILQTYGKVALIWIYHIPMVVVCSPDLTKEILVTKDYPKSGSMYAFMNSVYGQRYLGTGLVTNVNKEDWKIKRRLIDPAFHRKYLKFMVLQMNSCCDILINKLARKADGMTQVNMLNELSNLTLDVICKVGFSVDFNVILDENAPFKKAFEMAQQSSNDAFAASPLEMIRCVVFSASPQQKDAVEAIKFLRETGKEIIQKRQDKIKNGGDDLPLDLLTCILKTCESDNGTITMENLIDEFVTFFFAGHDTTASMLSSFLMAHSDHQNIEAKLVREMNDVMGVRSEVDFNDLANLKYTGFAIKEILRVYPPVSATIRVTVQEENIGGYSIPKGTSVNVNFYAACHNPEYFEEPFKFNPERWEISEEEKTSHYTWTPFSIGPRNCIGQMLALMEAKVVLTRLLQVFQFSLVDGQTKSMTDRVIVKSRDGVICTLKLREDS